MNLLDGKQDEVAAYFRNLGYRVSWDCKRNTGEVWYEIIDEHGIICQIDQGVPLEAIVEDLTCMAHGMAHGKEGTSEPVYKINLPDCARATAFLAKVATNQVACKHQHRTMAGGCPDCGDPSY